MLLLEVVVLGSVEEGCNGEGVVFGGWGAAELDEESVGVSHLIPWQVVVASLILMRTLAKWKTQSSMLYDVLILIVSRDMLLIKVIT